MKKTLFNLVSMLLFTATLLTTSVVRSQTAYDKLYWKGYNPTDLESINVNGTGQTIVAPGTSNSAFALEIDVPNQKVYWYDLDNDNIMRSDLNGANPTVFVPNIIDAQGISADFVNQRLYWCSTSSKTIESIKFDGTGRSTLLSTAFAGTPESIKVDMTHQKLYWFDHDNYHLKRINLDGTNPEVFISSPGGIILQMDIDEPNSHLYFPSMGGNTIERINLDGTGRTTLVSGFSNVGWPYALAIDEANSKIYWWDGDMYVIRSANFNGTAPQVFVNDVYSVAAMIVPHRYELLSKVVASQCGTTLSSIGAGINADAISGAVQYRFRVTNGANVQTIDKSTPLFAMTQLGSYAYNTTYSVEVAVNSGSGFGSYGTACNITTPFAMTQLQTSQCGATIAPSATLYANNVPGAIQYRFRITDGITTQTLDKAIRTFKINEFGSYLYGTTYTVDIAVNMGAGFGPYGTACNIYTPVISTKIQASQCNSTLTAMNTPIYADAVAGATQFRFRVDDGTNVQIKDNPTRVFYINSLPTYTYNQTYSIDVSAYVNGVWSPYGPLCNITTPFAMSKVSASQCGTTLATLNTPIYADNITGATHYRFRVVNGANVQTIDKVTRTFNLTELASSAYATTYTIDVAVEINGSYGPYGTACNVSTAASKVQASQCGTTLASLSTAIYADAVTGGTQYRFRVTNGSNVEIKDNATRILYLTTLASYAYGTTYSIDVAVLIGGVWTGYGPACDVSTPDAISKVQASQCGTTLATIGTDIYADNVTGGTHYRFRVTNGASVQTIDKATRVFKLTELATYAFSTAYTIDVAVETNGSYGPYGTACIVSTPVPSTKVQASQCGTTLPTISTAIYADVVPGGTQYRFRVSDGTNTQIKDNATRILYLTTLPIYEYNTAYTIDVAVFINGSWSAYGTACTVTSPYATTKLTTAYCDSVVSRTATIYANNLVGATQYRFRFTETANPSNVVTFDRPNRSIALGTLGLSLTTYTVDISLFYGGSWQPYGAACSLSPTAPRPQGEQTGVESRAAEAEPITFDAVTFPNPFINGFGISVTTESAEPVTVTVYDMSGKVLDLIKVSAEELNTLRIGESYAAGMYQVQVIQGTDAKTLKVVKQ